MVTMNSSRPGPASPAAGSGSRPQGPAATRPYRTCPRSHPLPGSPQDTADGSGHLRMRGSRRPDRTDGGGSAATSIGSSLRTSGQPVRNCHLADHFPIQRDRCHGRPVHPLEMHTVGAVLGDHLGMATGSCGPGRRRTGYGGSSRRPGWSRTGGTKEDVGHVPRRRPAFGLVPHEDAAVLLTQRPDPEPLDDGSADLGTGSSGSARPAPRPSP